MSVKFQKLLGFAFGFVLELHTTYVESTLTSFFVGLACRILQVGPRGSKFLGPVLIEVPHVASLRDGDREVVVLRCDSASKGNWTEHVQGQLDDKTLKVFTLGEIHAIHFFLYKICHYASISNKRYEDSTFYDLI